MNTLPSLNHALSSDFDYSHYKTSRSNDQSSQPTVKRTPIISSTPHRLQTGTPDSFRPIVVVGQIDMTASVRAKRTYAWTHVSVNANASA